MSTRMNRPKTAVLCVLSLVVALGVSGAFSLATAEAAAPAWSLSITHSPDTFHRGEGKKGFIADGYHVIVTNTGDAATAGPVTFTDSLPPGLTIAARTNLLGLVSGGASFECTGNGTNNGIVGASVLTCTRTATISPGESVPLNVYVAVSSDAPDVVINAATVSGGGASTAASSTDTTSVGDERIFGIESFYLRNLTASEGDYAVAGGHPDQNVTHFNFSTDDSEMPVENIKNVSVDLPIGFVGNPSVAPRCSISFIPEEEAIPGTICPVGSQVGVASVAADTGGRPLYNVKPDRGYPAQFAFNFAHAIVSLRVTSRPRTESYGLSVGSVDVSRLNASPELSLFQITTRFFGVPSQHGSGTTEAPFLSNPIDCSDEHLFAKLSVDTWEQPGRKIGSGVPDFSDPHWKTRTTPFPTPTECDSPLLASQFNPSIEARPTQGSGAVQADQPSGLAIGLDFPQNNDPTDPNTTFDPALPQAPEPKDITVKLPAGMSISPSSADGLSGCSDLASDPAGDQVHYDTVEPVRCPDASKIGTVTATTPLIAAHDPVTDAIVGADPIPGDVYLLKPHPGDLAQGQDGNFRLLIQLESPRYGINFKLPGVAVADKNTGQLTATFADNPQLPAKHLQVELKPGPRAPLASPVTCGNFTTTSNFVPWGTPGVPSVSKAASFSVGSGPNGSACAATPGARPFSPSLSAGTENAKAGAPSPFVMKLTRADGEQELGSLEVATPKGFSAKLAGVPYCPDSAIAAAAGKSGTSEQASPSCSSASQVGTITAGAGPGANPFYATGKAYLAGPYKGAPLSLAFITPAVAGPFDLGNVVVRAALQVDPESTQVTVKTDPLPQILDGVPLRLRSVTAHIDRPNFTLNPTNCSPMTVNATIASTDGAAAHPSNAFQVGRCKDLGFKPDLKLALKGGTSRGDHPALKATLSYPKGNYANIAKAVVSLPHSEFLDQAHIKTICTRVQFAADQCPAGSIYGYVTATTPLLDQPLSGPLYLRSSSHPLPDLVAALHGQIDVDLVGRIDSKNGGIRTTFDAVPDAPVTAFVLSMQGGKKGLLVNSRNLCTTVNKADVQFTAQNGRTAKSAPVLSNSCKKAKKRGKGAKGHRRTISWLPRSLGF